LDDVAVPDQTVPPGSTPRICPIPPVTSVGSDRAVQAHATAPTGAAAAVPPTIAVTATQAATARIDQLMKPPR
jgi:hypothetical protein